MKKNILLLLLLITFNLTSQDLSKVDEIIFSYPQINSVEELAKKIDYDFNTDLEKIKAAYSWLALNIDYYKENTILLKAPEYIIYTDKKDLKRRKKRRSKKIITEIFNKRKGVCEGYALSFKKICDLLSIENELIKGYAKTNPNEIAYLAKDKNHVWNGVKINNTWILVDVTFGSGYSFIGKRKSKLDNYYFNVKKEELNQTHYPSEKKWLEFMEQKSLNQFCNKPIFSKMFFISKAKLLSPMNGKIIVGKEENILLKLNGIKNNTKIFYSFSKNEIAKKPIITSFDSFTEITIDNPKKNSELNIYFNNSLALQYKVVIR